MTTTPAKPRPLSPHLGIYRLQISSVMSILHRATGIALAFGLIVLVAWLVFLAGGPGTYEAFLENLKNILGQGVVCGIVFVIAFCVLPILLMNFGLFQSRLLKWMFYILDFVIAAAVTVAARQYAADHFSESTDKVYFWAGQAFLFGMTWAFFYHLCCGIRHLLWDAGKFLSLRGMHITGWIVVVLSLLPTAFIWLKIYGVLP